MSQGDSNLPNDAAGPSVNSIPAAIRVIPSSDAEPESSGLHSAAHLVDASRVTGNTVAIRPDGIPGQRRQHAGSTVTGDAEDEDFVAVGHEDLEDYAWAFQPRTHHNRSRLDQLHPFMQLLSLANVDDCVKVEEAFPEHERCSSEKIIYRLTKCPELSLGIFSLPPTVANQPKPHATLVAHILATRTPSPQVTDATMGVPQNWQQKGTIPNGTDCEPVGHQDQGSTIAVHSLAVLDEHQGKGLGTTLMKAYIQRIKDAEIAERIALLAHDDLVGFYQGLGFSNLGASDCKFGNGGWYSMVLDLTAN